MKKRLKVLIIGVLLWLSLFIVEWALNAWLDANVTADNVSNIVEIIQSALQFITSGFGTGFILGAFLFSIWDWPVIGLWINKQRQRLRNKEADEELAKECDKISQYLYEQAATIERIRNENHWQASSIESSEDMHKSWIESRKIEAREEERIRRKIGQKVQNVFVKLKERGVDLDLWGFSLNTFELSSSSYFFAEIAEALRSGTYLEKEFKAGRSGKNVPARM